MRIFSRLFRRNKTVSAGVSKKRGPLWKRIALACLALGIAGGLLGVLTLATAFAWYSRDLPDPNTLMQRDIPLSTKIYDRTGTVLLRELHGDEKRTLVKIEDIPDVMKWATIAVEDKTFYTHHGINFRRLIKAVIVDVIEMRRAQGASTLTQQFIKNAVLTNEKHLNRKIKEIILALQIERLYSKDQILQLYFNEIPYGSTLYGIESAAQSYFGKKTNDLTLDEAALLAAIPQSTDFYSPYGTGSRGDNRDKLVQRQHLILSLMAEQGYITNEAADEAKKIETLKKLVPKKQYNILAPHLVKYVESQLFTKYGQRAVEEGGYKVITSLDWNLQQIAEEEVKKGVETRGEKYGFSNAGLVAVDPKTGQVLTLVGSKGFWDTDIDGQVNVALSPNQPGSSFKPIVYAAGFAKGYTPSMTLWDVNTKFKIDAAKDYEPKNYGLKENGPVSARAALQGSLNIPAVKMLYLVGVDRALDLADRLGYTTLGNRDSFGLSLVLGGGDVKLLDHTHAFATFANEGNKMPLVSILRVEDADGKVLEEWKPGEGDQVIDREAALQLSDVMSDNSARAYVFGQNNSLTLPKRPVAAKTGTTNDYRDAWTMGYVPQLASGVWVGNNDNSQMKKGADGSIIAAPIWQAFMKRATEKLPVETFAKPKPVQTTKSVLLGKSTETVVKIDKVSGKRATAFTPPELVEERTFHEAHSELWYLDKDDPAGPAPTNPGNDPQFSRWEAAVQDYVVRMNWNTTSTPPTEEDDVHTAGSTPTVSIFAPSANQTLSSRDGTVSVGVSAPRPIQKIEVYMEGQLVGSVSGNASTIQIHIPNSVATGFHDLFVRAFDDVGNRGETSVTINLTADAIPVSGGIASPKDGDRLLVSQFPVSVGVFVSDISNVQKVNLYLQETTTGDTRLLGSEISSPKTWMNFAWNTAPPPGNYYLYPVLITPEGTEHPGTSITVKVEN